MKTREQRLYNITSAITIVMILLLIGWGIYCHYNGALTSDSTFIEFFNKIDKADIDGVLQCKDTTSLGFVFLKLYITIAAVVNLTIFIIYIALSKIKGADPKSSTERDPTIKTATDVSSEEYDLEVEKWATKYFEKRRKREKSLFWVVLSGFIVLIVGAIVNIIIQ